MSAIQDDKKKLKKLVSLLLEYAKYIRDIERQPLAGSIIFKVISWVEDNLQELEG